MQYFIPLEFVIIAVLYEMRVLKLSVICKLRDLLVFCSLLVTEVYSEAIASTKSTTHTDRDSIGVI